MSMSGGGIMQLVAYGAQDVYLTTMPQITYFRLTYRRHTNFAPELINSDGSDNNGGNTMVPEVNIIYKLLSANTECIITYIIIEANGVYWECDTCNKVVCWEAAEHWISGHKNCPHCRCDATLDKKYINATEPVVKSKNTKKKRRLIFNRDNTGLNTTDNTTNTWRHQSKQYQNNIKTQTRNGRR